MRTVVHHMLRRIVSIGAMAVVALLAAGCRPTTASPAPLPAEVRFAREFIRILQDSGASAVLPLATPKTRALKGFAPNMDALRGVLASTHAAITLDQWNAVPGKDGKPSLVQVTFKVHGAGAPSGLELWIEEQSGRHLLNAIAIAPPNPGPSHASPW